VCGQDGGGSTAMKFFSSPLLFFSIGPWFSCNAFKDLVVSSRMYLF